ncbi:MAG: hypothetical protein ACHP6H_02555, partial [Legionellales bacterium]
PKTTHFIYDERGHLLFSIAADGTVTEMRYDDQGQLTSKRCYLIAAYEFELEDNQLPTKEALQSWVAKQNPEQVSLIGYLYDWRGQLIEEIHYGQVDAAGMGIDLGSLKTRSRYDAAGRLLEKSVFGDTGWITTQYLYDDLGRLILTRDNKQNSQSFEYDDQHQRIIQTDAKGLQTVKIYDKSGLLLTELRLDSSHSYGTTTYKYDAAGRLVAQTGENGLTQYYFYDSQGRVQAKVGSNGQMTEYVYTEDGLLLQTHQYDKPVTTTGWLEKLPIFSQIQPKNSSKDRISQNVYNARNQLAYVINAEGAVIAYEYDPQGQVLSQTAYAKRLANFNPELIVPWDSIQPLTDAADRSTFYYYDVQGRLQAKINGEGYAVEYHYNRMGSLIETCKFYNRVQPQLSGIWYQDKPDLNASKDIHTYCLYDTAGFKIADIDAEGYLTEYRYESGFLKETCAYEKALPKGFKIDETTSLDSIRPQGQANDHRTQYRYNELGALIEEKTQGGLVTTYEYEERGQLISKTLTDEITHTTRQQRYRYDALGRVIQSLDELGSALMRKPDLSLNDMELIWQAHSIQYEYDNAGLLLSTTNQLNQTTAYFYNTKGQLTYTLTADGAVVETTYNAFGQVELTKKYSAYLKSTKGLNTEELSARLALIQDERFDAITRYEYNTLGQVIATYTGTHGLITTSYTAFGDIQSLTQRINGTGNKETAFYYDRRGLLAQSLADLGGLAQENTYQYDSFGWVKKKTDGLLHQTSYMLNKRGEQVRITNASNHSKNMTYDAFGRVLVETDFTYQNQIKVFTYDDRHNRLILENQAAHTQIITQFNCFGDRVSIQDARGNTTEFTFDEKGQLTGTTSPEQAFKEYHYDAAGHLEWQLESGGLVTSYSYDAQGQVLSKTIDPKGLHITTTYQYDALGRQLQVIDANQTITRFTYDQEGNLLQSCQDFGGLNLVTEFAYDDRGLLLRQTEINPCGINKVTAYEWDNLGRRTATISDPEGLKLTTSYQYDANDNLVCQVDANKHSTHFIYDDNNLCHFQIDARGLVQEHIYDILGNETETISYARLIPSLEHYDESSLRSVLIKDLTQDHHQYRQYDKSGRVLMAYNEKGFATEYSYDANGNVVLERHYALAVSLEELNKGRRPIPNREGSRSQYYAYDGLNRLRFKCDSNGNVTESQYLANGQLKSTTQYTEPFSPGSVETFSIDNILNHLKPKPQTDQTKAYVYDKAGRLTTELSAQGIAKSYDYDELGNLTASTQYATRMPLTDFTQLSSISLIKSSKDRTNQYIYDAAGRERYRISAEGRVLERTYDSVGNITQELIHLKPVNLSDYTEAGIKKELISQAVNARQVHYKYDATGRLLSQVNASENEIQYIYDNEGNVVRKIEANKALWYYKYDEANQLIQSTSPLVLVTSTKGKEQRAIITRNTYDSFGNLTCQIRDAEGVNQKVLYEYDSTNKKIKTIIPEARVNNSGTSASSQRQENIQTLCEDIQYNAFGEVTATSDKMGNWKHFAYDGKGLLIFNVDTKGGLIQYRYDAFGQVIEKTQYAEAIRLAAGSDYSIKTIAASRTTSTKDRHEYYAYNLDNQLIETSRDAVRMYNAKTGHYDSTLKPTTQIEYNAFGEVTKTATKINETDWASTYTYFDKDGKKIASVDALGYLTTYLQNAYGDTESMTEYANAISNWNIDQHSSSSTSMKDRTVTFTYNAMGLLSSKTLKNVTYQRLKDNGKSYESLTSDLTTSYGYDALGNCTTITDAKGNTSYSYYNELGQLIAKVAPQTQSGRAATTFAYDSLGHLVQTIKWAQGAS